VLGLLAAALVRACPDALAQTAPPVTPERLERLLDASLDGLMARQLPWGGFDDPLAGARFNYGAVSLAWLAGERSLPGAAGAERRRAAALTLGAATRVERPGAFQAWIEALALRAVRGRLADAETRAALTAHLQRYAGPVVGRRAQRCATNPHCYNNLKLVDAVGTLDLVRTGISSPLPGARLADPPTADRLARSFLATSVARAQHADLGLRAAAVDVRDAAVLSDPSRNPLAYHALSSALLVRGLRLLGDEAPAPARLAAHRALWALVALADPRGEISWMGRGQQLVWPVGATLYAALGATVEVSERDPALAARLRRLAELATLELEHRRTANGLAVTPGARSSLAGLDHSTDTIACNGLGSPSCASPLRKRPPRAAWWRRSPPSCRGRPRWTRALPESRRCAPAVSGSRSIAPPRIRATPATTSGSSPPSSGPRPATGSRSSASVPTPTPGAGRRRPVRCSSRAGGRWRPPAGWWRGTAASSSTAPGAAAVGASERLCCTDRCTITRGRT
jgi:hypothetical protein